MRPPPPLAQNFFIFMQFFGKNLPINRLVPPLPRVSAPSSGKSWIRHCSVHLGNTFTIFILISGTLYDMTGSFHWSFYSAGAMLFLAGFICLPLRRIARWKDRREKERTKKGRSGKTYKNLNSQNSNTDSKETKA